MHLYEGLLSRPEKIKRCHGHHLNQLILVSSPLSAPYITTTVSIYNDILYMLPVHNLKYMRGTFVTPIVNNLTKSLEVGIKHIT